MSKVHLKASELEPGQKFLDSVRNRVGGIGGLYAEGPYDVFTRTSDPIEGGKIRAYNEAKREFVTFDSDVLVKWAFWIE